MKLLEKIFSIRNSIDKKHKVITIIGFKLKIKRKKSDNNLKNIEVKIDILHRELNRNIQKNISIAMQHQRVFMPYKNIYNGKNLVLIATGPTLNYYEPLSNVIIFGCNSAFKKDIPLDFLFMQDYEAVKDYIEDVPKYVSEKCNIFYGYTMEYNKKCNQVIPESTAIEHNAHRYYTDWAKIKDFKPEFVQDISTQPLCCWGTIAFPVMQFMLWTNPKKIYLVGCDCSNSHYDNSPLVSKNLKDLSHLIRPWKILKQFIQIYYPKTEIISVNPVGLKGIFKDVYTQSYLDEHPEIKEELGNDIEILVG